MDRLNHRIQRFHAQRHLHHQGRRPWHPAGHVLLARGRRRVTGRHRVGRRHPRRPDRAVHRPACPTPSSRRPVGYGATGPGGNSSSYPEGADVDANGVVWIADTRNHRIQTFNPITETFRSSVRHRAPAPASSGSDGVAVTADAVYVADTGNNRIQKLTSTASTGQLDASGSTAPRASTSRPTAPSGWPTPTTTGSCTCARTSPTWATASAATAPGTTSSSTPTTSRSATTSSTSPTPTTTGSRSTSCPRPVEPPPSRSSRAYDRADLRRRRPRAALPGRHRHRRRRHLVRRRLRRQPHGHDRPADRRITTIDGAGPQRPARPRCSTRRPPTALWVLDTGGNRVLQAEPPAAKQAGRSPGSTSPTAWPRTTTGSTSRTPTATSPGATTSRPTARPRGPRPPARQGVLPSAGRRAWLDDGQSSVADTDNDRIVLLNAATGAASTRSAPGHRRRPVQVARARVTSDGAAACGSRDAFNYRIQHLTRTGASLGATAGRRLRHGPEPVPSPRTA